MNDQFVTEFFNKLSNQKGNGEINQTLYDDTLTLVSNKLNFCNGVSECKASISTQLDTSYKAGVASVDVNTIGKTAYDKGYTDGKASFVCEEPKDPVTKKLTEAEVRTLWTVSCDCKSAKNHGAYVSCTANFLDGLVKANVLEDALKGTLQSEAAKSTCGKKEKGEGESEGKGEGKGEEPEDTSKGETSEMKAEINKIKSTLAELKVTLEKKDREIKKLKRRTKVDSKGADIVSR